MDCRTPNHNTADKYLSSNTYLIMYIKLWISFIVKCSNEIISLAHKKHDYFRLSQVIHRIFNFLCHFFLFTLYYQSVKMIKISSPEKKNEAQKLCINQKRLFFFFKYFTQCKNFNNCNKNGYIIIKPQERMIKKMQLS